MAQNPNPRLLLYPAVSSFIIPPLFTSRTEQHPYFKPNPKHQDMSKPPEPLISVIRLLCLFKKIMGFECNFMAKGCLFNQETFIRLLCARHCGNREMVTQSCCQVAFTPEGLVLHQRAVKDGTYPLLWGIPKVLRED